MTDGCVLQPFFNARLETPAGRGADSSDRWSVGRWPSLLCTVDGGATLSVTWQAFEGFDVRSAPVGPVIARDSWGYTPATKDEKAYVARIACAMSVEASKGGPAAFPALVTPNFRKTVRYTCTSDPQLGLGLELTAIVEVDASMFRAKVDDTCPDVCEQ